MHRVLAALLIVGGSLAIAPQAAEAYWGWYPGSRIVRGARFLSRGVVRAGWGVVRPRPWVRPYYRPWYGYRRFAYRPFVPYRYSYYRPIVRRHYYYHHHYPVYYSHYGYFGANDAAPTSLESDALADSSELLADSDVEYGSWISLDEGSPYVLSNARLNFLDSSIMPAAYERPASNADNGSEFKIGRPTRGREF